MCDWGVGVAADHDWVAGDRTVLLCGLYAYKFSNRLPLDGQRDVADSAAGTNDWLHRILQTVFIHEY